MKENNNEIRGNNMKREAYLKRLVFLWQIRVTLFSLPIMIIAFFISKFAFMAVLVLQFCFAALFLPFYLKSCRVTLFIGYLMFERGIIFKTRSIIPYNKIIYLKCLETPLSSRFGLSLAEIKLIGSVVFLPELALQDIKKLKLLVEEAANWLARKNTSFDDI